MKPSSRTIGKYRDSCRYSLQIMTGVPSWRSRIHVDYPAPATDCERFCDSQATCQTLLKPVESCCFFAGRIANPWSFRDYLDQSNRNFVFASLTAMPQYTIDNLRVAGFS